MYYNPTPEAEGHLSIKVPPHDFAENIIGNETTIICHPSQAKQTKNQEELQHCNFSDAAFIYVVQAI